MNFLTTSPPKSSNAIAIGIYDILGESDSLAEHQGRKISDLIAAAFREDKSVILSFKHLEKLTWSFVKGAINKLYESFPDEQIESSLSLVDIEPDELEFINKVVYEKKEDLKDPHRVRKPLSNEELEALRKQNPNNPWLQVAGKYKDDPDFEQMLAFIEEDRRQLDAEMEEYYRQLDAAEEKGA